MEKQIRVVRKEISCSNCNRIEVTLARGTEADSKTTGICSLCKKQIKRGNKNKMTKCNECGKETENLFCSIECADNNRVTTAQEEAKDEI